jgi:hypothetical protein
MAFLIAESKKLNQNRNNPVAAFRKKAMQASSSAKAWKSQQEFSSADRESLKRKGESSSYTGSFGDGMPDTSKAMNDLFGIHPLPKRRKVSTKKSLVPSSSSSSDKHVNTPGAEELVSEYPTEMSRDVHHPNRSLMTSIRQIMTDKIGSYLTQSKIPVNQHRYYENVFDSSALTAIGIFAEESIQELLRLWKRTQTPLIFSTNSLQSEIYTQLNSGDPQLRNSTDHLQSVLEELFQRNLDSSKEFIEEKKMEFIQVIQDHQRPESSPRSVSPEDHHLPYQVVNLSKRNISLKEKEYESSDLHLPILSDAKRQMTGGKRVNFEHWPEHLIPKKETVQTENALQADQTVPTDEVNKFLQIDDSNEVHHE